jgi:hypothetical protein
MVGNESRLVYVAFHHYHAIIKWWRWRVATIFNTFDEASKRWPYSRDHYKQDLQFRFPEIILKSGQLFSNVSVKNGL